MQIPRWIVLSVFLFVCLFLSWFVYDRYNDHPSLKHVAAVLADITEAGTKAKQVQIRNYFQQSILCLEHSGSQNVVQTNLEMRKFITLLDSSKYLLDKMASQSYNRWAARETFGEYQSFINRNAAILENHSQAGAKTLFNEYLKLNNQLLPEDNQTKGKNAVMLSVVLLEEALTEQILVCMTKLSGNLGDCEPQNN